MSDAELLKKLEEAIAREMQVSIQYMWQHVLARGVRGKYVGDALRAIALVEMAHAERIAERLVFLGGKPPIKPSPITIGDSVEEMLKIDVEAEKEAIEMYKEIIQLAEKKGDYVTRRLFEDILVDEENHLDQFQNLME